MFPPRQRVLLAFAPAFLALAPSSAAQGWPDIYHPLMLHDLELELAPADWATVVGDETFDIEVPAAFGLAGEPKILVSVRRKSATALGQKVSLKIDVNEYVSGQEWHDLKKLSLENGDDENVVREGFAWYLHRRAAGVTPSGYMPGLAAWVRLLVNGDDLGVYLSVEQPDKQFLQNRGVYIADQTWLYKVSDLGQLELEVGLPDSPVVAALCYEPFQSGSGACPKPGAATFAAELETYIDMAAMLTLGAVEAFHTGPDMLFTKGKNFFFADFLTAKRQYIPWDLDSVLGGGGSGDGIYPSGGGYSEILSHPTFSPQYEQILAELLDQPFQQGDLLAFLDTLEALLDAPLSADPNNNLSGTVAEEFDSLRAWIQTRIATVGAEIGWAGPPSCGALPYGVGLGGANVATLGSSAPPALGTTLVLDVASPGSTGMAFLLIALEQAHVPLFGGIVLIDPTSYFLVPIPLTGGAGSLAIPLPSDPVFAGFSVFAQAVAKSASIPEGSAFTNGLRITLCP